MFCCVVGWCNQTFTKRPHASFQKINSIYFFAVATFKATNFVVKF